MILLIGFAALFYTISGGVRTAASTDVLQFILVVIGITILTQTLFAKVGGVQNMISEWETKEIGKLHFWKSKGIISMLLSMLLYGVFPVRIFMPPFFQRYQMVQDKHRIYRLFGTFGIFYFLVRLLLGLAGISLFKLKGVGSYSGLEAPALFAAVISSDLFSSTTQTLIFLMVIALGMSTVDSYMNAVSIVIARDLIKPFSPKINELKLVCQVSFGLGVLCMLLAPYVPDPGLLFTASVASLGFLFFPLLTGIGQKRVHTKAFVLSTGSFFLTLGGVWIAMSFCNLNFPDIVSWNYEVSSFGRIIRVWCVAMVVSTPVFFATNWWLNRRFVSKKKKLKKTRTVRTWPHLSPARWVRERVAKYGRQSTAAAFFISISCMIPHLSPSEMMVAWENLFLGSRVIGIVLCTGLLLKDVWPSTLRPYFDLYWFGTLTYCLPFVNTLWFLLDHEENTTAWLRMSLAILLLVVLVDWRSFIIMKILGVVAAVLIQFNLYGIAGFFFSQDEWWYIVMGLGSSVLVGLLFARRKERTNEHKVIRVKVLGCSLGHEIGNSLRVLWGNENMRSLLEKTVTVTTNLAGKKQHTFTEADFVKMVKKQKLIDFGSKMCVQQINMFRQLIQHDGVPEAKLRNICIAEALDRAVSQFKRLEYSHASILTLTGNPDSFTVRIFSDLFGHVIHNLVKNAIIYGGAKKVTVRWNTGERAVYVENDGAPILAHVLPHIFDPFYTTQKGSSTGVGLPLVKMVMESFHGSAKLVKSGETSTIFKLTFPTKGDTSKVLLPAKNYDLGERPVIYC